MQSSDSQVGRDRARGSQTVFRTLRGWIVDGTIAPDTRLNIDALARQLGVSQTPIREALRRMEGENLVTSQAGRGYKTTDLLDLDQLRALYEFRQLIESWAAGSVAVHRLTNPAPGLRKELSDVHRSLADSADIRLTLMTHDMRFHRLIIAATGNDVVLQAYEQTHCHIHTYRLYDATIDSSATLAEHERITDAIGDYDSDAAVTAMNDHITASFARYA